jgi:phage shock protein A
MTNERLDEQRRKYTDLWDEYLDRKIHYEKSIALSSQQNEFFGNKVDELEKQLDSANQRYEERLRLQKQEWAEELNS